MGDDLTGLQEEELKALAGDRVATIMVVSGLRRYRALVASLMKSRWRDGTVDGPSARSAEFESQRIETLDDDDANGGG